MIAKKLFAQLVVNCRPKIMQSVWHDGVHCAMSVANSVLLVLPSGIWCTGQGNNHKIEGGECIAHAGCCPRTCCTWCGTQCDVSALMGAKGM